MAAVEIAALGTFPEQIRKFMNGRFVVFETYVIFLPECAEQRMKI